MDPVKLYNLLKELSFPIQIRLRDGRCYDVAAREFAVVGRTYLDIGAQLPNAPMGIWGPTTILELHDISSIESLASRASVVGKEKS
jgi:hypothetical protein